MPESKSNPAPNLVKLIIVDLFTVGLIPLILLTLIFMTAMSVVFMTHHSRQAISDKDHTLQERERLDNEWRNLILEETALSEHTRVESMAKSKLNMKRPEPDKEVVITFK